MSIKPGDIIHSPRWAEPVEVNMLQEFGDYVRFLGVTLRSRQHIDQLMPQTDLVDRFAAVFIATTLRQSS
jgi:hypothetical protein